MSEEQNQNLTDMNTMDTSELMGKISVKNAI